MDILLQSDGQLYPPKRTERRPEPPPPPKPKPPPPPSKTLPKEELLLAAVAYILIKNSDKPDIPLLLALAYILFDPKINFPF